MQNSLYNLIKQLLIRENLKLHIYAPILLGIGILFGVYFPISSIHNILYLLIIPILLCKNNYFTTAASVFIAITGFYIAQTGGILKTTNLANIEYLQEDIKKISAVADVQYIEHTHPVMKNMKRIVLTNLSYNNKNFHNIHTIKMTIGSKLLKDIQPMDKVYVVFNLFKTQNPLLPGTFDRIQYNVINGIDANGVVLYIKKLQSKNYYNLFSYIRFKIANTISKYINGDANGILIALATGDKSAIKHDIREYFTKSGTAHILAISGLHMSLVATIIFMILKILFLYLKNIILKLNATHTAAICTIPIIFLYLIFSGCSPSAIRAFIMTTIALIAITQNKRIISISNIAFAAFIILLFNPASLFHVSFQMSFAAVIALVSVYNLPIIHSSNNTIVKYIFTSLITTLVASIATIPFSVATFNRVSITGILGNLIAIPIVSFLIIPIGMLSIIFHFLLPILEILVNLLIKAMHFTSNLPYSEIIAKTPNNITVYIFVIGGIILCILKTKLKLFGLIPILYSFFLYYKQEIPKMIILPGNNAAIIKHNNMYVNSLKKCRTKFLSIAYNLGISKKPIKGDFLIPSIEPQNTVVIFKHNTIMYVKKSKNPLCPAFYTSKS